MIKKPALILLAIAIILGGTVYYFDWKRGSSEKTDTFKRAFNFQASDISAMILSHPSQPSEPAIHFVKRGDSWQIVDPVETNADQSTVDGIADQVAGAEITATEPGTPDRLKAFGLDPPQASLELDLANGSKHTLLLGSKTFDNASVYAIVDGGQQVGLLPELLSASTARNLDTLRDRAVLHFESGDTASFSLKNSSGEIEAAKQDDHWKMKKPIETFASSDSVDSLLQAISGANMVSVASEKSDDLAQYGLTSPAITFTDTNSKGAQYTLLVGKKDGDNYFARDVSRPMIFRINADLYNKLSQKFADLRDKKVLHFDSIDVQQLELHNSNGVITIGRKKDAPDDWTFSSPPDQKGKAASDWKIVDPLTGLSAEEVIDHPPPAIVSSLANPAVTAIITTKNGKTMTLKISKASGDFVYAQASDAPALYKLKKDVLDTLSLKASDVAQ